MGRRQLVLLAGLFAAIHLNSSFAQDIEVREDTRFAGDYTNYQVFERKTQTQDYREYRLEPRNSASGAAKTERVFRQPSRARKAVRAYAFLDSLLGANSALQTPKYSKASDDALVFEDRHEMTLSDALKFSSGLSAATKRRLLARYDAALHGLVDRFTAKFGENGSVWISEIGPYVDIPEMHMLTKSDDDQIALSIKPENVLVNLTTLTMTVPDL